MKKIKLRRWVEVLLKIVLLIDMFIMVCEAQSLKVMLFKTIITILIMLPIIYLLICYGGNNDKRLY